MTAVVSTETVIDFVVAHNSDWEQCGGCEKVFFWKKLPDADIPAGREHKPGTFHGVAAIAGNHGGNPGRNGKKMIPIQMRCIRL